MIIERFLFGLVSLQFGMMGSQTISSIEYNIYNCLHLFICKCGKCDKYRCQNSLKAANMQSSSSLQSALHSHKNESELAFAIES